MEWFLLICSFLDVILNAGFTLFTIYSFLSGVVISFWIPTDLSSHESIVYTPKLIVLSKKSNKFQKVNFEILDVIIGI